jgi:putative ABC transport system permease protein
MALVPLKYNVRNLGVRRTTTILTVLVTAISVTTTCVMFGLIEGLNKSNVVSGDPYDVLVLRKGATSETGAGFAIDKAQELAVLNGVAKAPPLPDELKEANLIDTANRPFAAFELVNIPVVTKSDGRRTNLIVRGVDPASPLLRRDFRIVAGRYFTPGTDQCIVAAPIAGRYRGAALGDRLKVGENESYEVVGLFTAGGGAAESEVWVDRSTLARVMKAEGMVSSVQLRATDAAARDQILKEIKEKTQLAGLDGMTEVQFFEKSQGTAIFLTVIGSLIGVAMSIGAMFAAANAMFAAVKSRTREIGTMRALGFPRRAILLSFLGESLLICALGGAIGCLATFLFRSWSFGIIDFATFADRSFQLQVGPLVLGVALAMTLAMGLFGGLFPAIRAVRLDVIRSLREV